MTRRARFESKMDESTEELRNHYPILKMEFFSFFPDLAKILSRLAEVRLNKIL